MGNGDQLGKRGMKTTAFLEMGRRMEAWTIVSLRLRKSGIAVDHRETVGLAASWEIHYKVMGYVNKFVSQREIVEFIMDPQGLTDGEVRKIYNPELEPWLSEEESSRLRTRIIKHLNLPESLPLWGPAPPESNIVWDEEDLEALFSTHDEMELDKALDQVRRRRTYRKFGL
jgi:hypothetical protein